MYHHKQGSHLLRQKSPELCHQCGRANEPGQDVTAAIAATFLIHFPFPTAWDTCALKYPMGALVHPPPVVLPSKNHIFSSISATQGLTRFTMLGPSMGWKKCVNSKDCFLKQKVVNSLEGNLVKQGGFQKICRKTELQSKWG